MASEGIDRFAPAPDRRPIEAIIGTNMARRAIVVAPVLAVVFGLLRGWPGAVAALVGVAIVVVNFVLGGYVLSYAAGVSLSLYHAAALVGFFVRLGLITLSMLLVAGMTDIDRLALGLSVVVSYLALLSWETVAIVNGAERDLQWSD
jgi:hypothetical protein